MYTVVLPGARVQLWILSGLFSGMHTLNVYFFLMKDFFEYFSNCFFFLIGIIKAKQLEYSEAHKNLIQAIRKAPQFSAVGFRQIVSSS